MFILPNLIADQLTTLFINLGVSEHVTECYKESRKGWVETGEFDSGEGLSGLKDTHKHLLIRLPTYQIKYSMAWMEDRWHQGAILWTNKKGFSFIWVLAE